MEPQFQTSFIPKKPIVSGIKDSTTTEHHVNFLYVSSIAIFVAALVLSGALYGYKQLLNKQINDANANIVAAKDAFQIDTIKELTDVSSRITQTQRLLNSHVATFQIFNVLQSLTVKNLRFTNFLFENKNDTLEISMDTEARSYNALAEQLDVFSKSDYIKNPKFLDFDVSENGNILTKFQAIIDPTSLSYKKMIDSLNSNQ